MNGDAILAAIGTKVDELSEEAFTALAAARDNLDYAEAAVAASSLAALQRVRQRIWELEG